MEDEFELCSLYSDEGKIMVPQVTFDLNQLQMLLSLFCSNNKQSGWKEISKILQFSEPRACTP